MFHEQYSTLFTTATTPRTGHRLQGEIRIVSVYHPTGRPSARLRTSISSGYCRKKGAGNMYRFRRATRCDSTKLIGIYGL